MTDRSLLFVTQTHCVWGGMEWWVHNFSQWLIGAGWRVIAGLALGERYNDPRAYHAAHPHLEPLFMDGRAGSDRTRVNAVVDAIRTTGARFVIPIGIGAAIPAAAIAKQERPLYLIAPVFSLHPDWIVNLVDSFDAVDRVVGNSRLITSALLHELPPADSSRIHYVPQGTPPAVRKRDARSGTLRVGYVGRLEQSSKRIFDLVLVADALQAAGVRVEMHVYGEGPDRTALESQLGERAAFHGFVPTPDLYRDVYPSLDVLLLFSPTEGSPNVIYEAMQNGVVPVCSRFLGLASERILIDGRNSLTFAVGDAAAAANHVARLARDRVLLEQLSVRARETPLWSIEQMHEAWERVLIEAAEEAPKKPARRPPPLPRGKLERLGVGPALAARLRRAMGRGLLPADGWAEWPGTLPADPASCRRIAQLFEEIDRRALSGDDR
ncbi:MAG TPA: glycosyltransferase family 4 protein [Thermoanaerobaculia bacterium]|nr:glycosyltransferase family 4 protein [Thermoanaerobaculia bacterium]